MKTKAKILAAVFTSLSVIIIAVAVHAFIYYSELVSASEKVTEYHQREYLRIKIYGTTWDNDINTISGQFTIIDKNGSEMAAIERSWTGNYLAIEFTVLDLKGKQYIFPSCIYGKNKILEGKKYKNKGTRLSKYYLDNKQCLLPGNPITSRASREEKAALFRIAAFADSRFPVILSGSRSIFTVDLSRCKTGNYYSIVYSENEGFSVQKL